MKNNLKTIRENAGFTLQELALMCGKNSRTYIHYLEHESANPTLNTAYAISAVLGVEVTDIWPNDVEVVSEEKIVRRVVKRG